MSLLCLQPILNYLGLLDNSANILHEDISFFVIKMPYPLVPETHVCLHVEGRIQIQSQVIT